MQIPEYYEFFSQAKFISGAAALENIPTELGGYDAHKPLVIASHDLRGSRIVKKFIKAFYDSKMVLGGIFDEVRDYASIALARDAAFLFKERGCDSIIALGNGTTVDVAKAANILLSEKTDNLGAFYEGKAISRNMKPFILVPTCCAKGMEASATINIDNRRITSTFLYPDVICIDPRMTRGCCSKCIAESGVIALGQTFMILADESNNPMADTYAHSALSFLSENLVKGVKRPGNKTTSLALANASMMASIACSATRPGILNLLSEEMAKSTGISQGIAARTILPSIMEYKLKKNKIRDELCLALAGLDSYARTPANERPKKSVDIIMGILGSLKKILPDSLSSLNIPRYKLEEVAKSAAARSAKRYTENECLKHLEQAW